MSSGHGARRAAAPPCPGVASVSSSILLARDPPGCRAGARFEKEWRAARAAECERRVSASLRAGNGSSDVGNEGRRALTPETVAQLDRWWRAANYLSVGQIYLLANPLLREPLARAHKPRLLGHWGTTPGLNFVYAHMNRAIRERDLDAIYVAGPGHGGQRSCANT